MAQQVVDKAVNIALDIWRKARACPRRDDRGVDAEGTWFGLDDASDPILLLLRADGAIGSLRPRRAVHGHSLRDIVVTATECPNKSFELVLIDR